MILRSLALSAALLAVSAAPAAAAFTPGADGAGDPFYPQAGNGGYEARSYSLKLAYEPQNEQLDGDVTMTARATQDLSSFNLDLRGLKVESVTVNGAAASFARKDQELTITPDAGIRTGREFTTRVIYGGHVNYVLDPDHSKDGWIPTDDGAYVVNEPQGAPTWFPVNDTPKDFATYEFAITVPEGKTALANGRLVSKTDNGDTTTWRWRESSPMVPYLTTATNGVFELRIGRVNGLPEYNAVDPQTRRFGQKEPNPELAFERLALNEPAIDLFNELYGRYPYDSVGGIVDWADNVFYSLESQTKPNYWHAPVRGHGRPRDRPPVVRRRGRARALARHVAERGLRDLVRVDLVRAPGGQPLSSASTSSTPSPRTRPLARISGSRRRTRWRTLPSCFTRRSTTAAP